MILDPESGTLYAAARQRLLRAQFNWFSGTKHAVIIGGGYLIDDLHETVADIAAQATVQTVPLIDIYGTANGWASSARALFDTLLFGEDVYYAAIAEQPGSSAAPEDLLLVAYLGGILGGPVPPRAAELALQFDMNTGGGWFRP